MWDTLKYSLVGNVRHNYWVLIFTTTYIKFNVSKWLWKLELNGYGCGTLSIPKCPQKKQILGMSNNCPHPYTALSSKTWKVSTKLQVSQHLVFLFFLFFLYCIVKSVPDSFPLTTWIVHIKFLGYKKELLDKITARIEKDRPPPPKPAPAPAAPAPKPAPAPAQTKPAPKPAPAPAKPAQQVMYNTKYLYDFCLSDVSSSWTLILFFFC